VTSDLPRLPTGSTTSKSRDLKPGTYTFYSSVRSAALIRSQPTTTSLANSDVFP
jgi:hypothetical protein